MGVSKEVGERGYNKTNAVLKKVDPKVTRMEGKEAALSSTGGDKRKVLEWKTRPFGLKKCKSRSQRPIVIVGGLEIQVLPSLRRKPKIDGGEGVKLAAWIMMNIVDG